MAIVASREEGEIGRMHQGQGERRRRRARGRVEVSNDKEESYRCGRADRDRRKEGRKGKEQVEERGGG